MGEEPVYEFRDFQLDIQSAALTRGGIPIPLPPKTPDTLMVLVRKRGQLLDKDFLLKTIWPDAFVEEGNLGFQISTLRKALGEEGASLIETVPRRGYRFTEPVREIRRGTAVQAPVKTILDSIAVLPFLNFSADPDNEYFSDGLTEEIINALANVPGLRVVSRTSTFAYKTRHDDIREIATKLRVSTVLEGSVRKDGERIRVTAQLIDACSGLHLWSRTYDRDLTDIFAIQEELSRAIAVNLGQSLLQSVQPAADLESYNLYLRGRYQAEKITPEDIKLGIQYFERAIRRSPEYALPYAGLAEAYLLLGGWTFQRPDVAMPLARQAAQKALELNPRLAEAHSALGGIYTFSDWDLPRAEQAALRAMELGPGHSRYYVRYGTILSLQGRHDESIQHRKTGVDLDPLSPVAITGLALTYYHARDWQRAMEQCQAAIDLDPNYARAHTISTLVAVQTGRVHDVIPAMKNVISMTADEPFYRVILAYAYAANGNAVEALRILNSLQAGPCYTPASYYIATVYGALGDPNQAMVWLERAVRERAANAISIRVDPALDCLRSDPRFPRLLDAIRC